MPASQVNFTFEAKKSIWNEVCRKWYLVVVMFLFSILLWMPAIFTPFWGDDYVFLKAAQTARFQGDSWWLPFWPNVQAGFWRPLSMDCYFRFVESVLNANVKLAHALNFLLWFLSCSAVGLLAGLIGQRLDWARPLLLGTLTAVTYGLSAIHLLSIHWVSAANSSFIVFFAALAMAVWVGASKSEGWLRILMCLLLPLFQILALFSKESSILIPFLLLCITVFTTKKIKLSRPEMVAWLSCIVICIVWFFLFKKFTGSRAEGYNLVLGGNLIRNMAALVAWFLNVPREALRMILTTPKIVGLLWAAACALPMLVCFFLAIRSLMKEISLRQLVALIAFVVLAYGPYFLLESQSYEYYASIAVMLPFVLLSKAILIAPRAPIMVALLCFSSLIAIQGSREVADPSLLGRALWAEQQFDYLSKHAIQKPFIIHVTNDHQFYAMGIAGLSWRLGIAESDIILSKSCIYHASKILEQQEDGNFEWRDC